MFCVWRESILFSNYLPFIRILSNKIRVDYKEYSRSQWPRSLRRRSASARLLRSWVRIPLGDWVFFCCECCVLSGRVLGDELITRPEESNRLWCVVVCDLETSRMWRPWPALGCSATGNNTNASAATATTKTVTKTNVVAAGATTTTSTITTTTTTTLLLLLYHHHHRFHRLCLPFIGYCCCQAMLFIHISKLHYGVIITAVVTVIILLVFSYK